MNSRTRPNGVLAENHRSTFGDSTFSLRPSFGRSPGGGGGGDIVTVDFHFRSIDYAQNEANRPLRARGAPPVSLLSCARGLMGHRLELLRRPMIDTQRHGGGEKLYIRPLSYTCTRGQNFTGLRARARETRGQRGAAHVGRRRRRLNSHKGSPPVPREFTNFKWRGEIMLYALPSVVWK